MRNITTRNNILHVLSGMNSISKGADESKPETEDYGYDMVMPDIDKDYQFTPNFYNNHRIEAIPNYDGQAVLHGNRRGNFKLKVNTTGVGEGRCIDNIIPLKYPDIGAQDSSASHMYFGVDYIFTVPNIEECEN